MKCKHLDLLDILKEAIKNPLWIGNSITCFICKQTLRLSDPGKGKEQS